MAVKVSRSTVKGEWLMVINIHPQKACRMLKRVNGNSLIVNSMVLDLAF